MALSSAQGERARLQEVRRVFDLAHPPERIAVVQATGLAEVLFVTPLVRTLKLAWPEAHLTLLTRPELAPVGACIPGVDVVQPFDSEGLDAGLGGVWRVARALGGPQMVLVPKPDDRRSAALAWLTRAPTRVGVQSGLLGHLFTVKVPLRKREPLVERSMDLARALGMEGPTELVVSPPPEELERMRAALGDEPSVGIVLGAEWKASCWPLEAHLELASRASEAGLRPVLVGGQEDRPLADEFQAKSKVRALDLVGRTAVETLCALSLLRVAYGGDAGWVHAARAVGTPTLLLFGPTDPGAHLLEYFAQALRVGLDCQPCGQQAWKGCPLGHSDCLRKLEVDRVWGALSSLLACRGRE